MLLLTCCFKHVQRHACGSHQSRNAAANAHCSYLASVLSAPSYLLTLPLAPHPPPPTPPSPQDLQAAKQQLSSKEAELKELGKELSKLNKERGSLQNSSQKLNKQLSKRSEQADDLQVGGQHAGGTCCSWSAHRLQWGLYAGASGAVSAAVLW